MLEEQNQVDAKIDVNSLKASMDAARKFEKDTPVITEAPKEKVVVTDPLPEAKATTDKPAEQPKVERQEEAAKQPKEDGKGIKALRNELDARGEKLKQLEQQLAEFEGTRKERDELKSRIETLEQERERLSKIESVAALEQSEEFQNKYVKGAQAHYDKLAELATYADIDIKDLESALSKSGKERVSAMEDLLATTGRYIAEDIVQEVKLLDKLEAERKAELNNAHESLQRRLQERESMTRKQLEEQYRVRTEAWKQIETSLAKDLPLTEDVKAKAAEFFAKNTDATRAAEITIKGHAYDALSAKVAELQAELAKYQKSSPIISAGVRESSSSVDDKLSVAERINRQLQEMGFGRR